MTEVQYWRELSSREVTQLYTRNTSRPVIVLFPIGVVEAHGPYLPLGLDSMVVRILTHLAVENVQQKLAGRAQLVIFDSLADLGVISATFELDGGIPYPGMLTTELLFFTIRSMYEKGLRDFFVINGDGGTGNSLRALMFRSTEERRSFFKAFGANNGTFNFITWFDGVKKKIEHAGAYEHAIPEYLADLSDDHTRALANKFDINSRLLTDENLHALEAVPQKTYPTPRTEIVSWKMIPGQEQFAAATPFCLRDYNEILESGAVEMLWKQQLEKVSDYIYQRILHIYGWEDL